MSRNLFRDCEVVQCIVVLGRTRQVSRRSGFLGGGSHFLYGILPKLKGRPEPNVSGFLSQAEGWGESCRCGCRRNADGAWIEREDLECPFLNHLGRGQDGRRPLLNHLGRERERYHGALSV
uniref:Uncharacterized protein n=1 Tax=Timema genevievae TaxID=629358 RepID=A0A7R9PJ76_TIMGE|nr:unnamed protein product [Timema genevievae]